MPAVKLFLLGLLATGLMLRPVGGLPKPRLIIDSSQGAGVMYVFKPNPDSLRGQLVNLADEPELADQFLGRMRIVYQRYSDSFSSFKSGFSRCASDRDQCLILEKMSSAQNSFYDDLDASLSRAISKNGWKSSAAKLGAGVAAILLGVGSSILSTGTCLLSGKCGVCRNFYIDINSGSVDGDYQGPILLFNSTRYDWGTTCQPFSELIKSGHAGVGGVGSSPRTVFTGVEGSVVYNVLDLSGKATDCRLRVQFDNPYSGSNSYSAVLEGGGCDPSLRVQAGQYIKGDSAQVQFYAWYDTIWASTENGAT